MASQAFFICGMGASREEEVVQCKDK